jgi:hypothetical protein
MQLFNQRMVGYAVVEVISDIESGLCELTFRGHTSLVYWVIHLFDGRICSVAIWRKIVELVN